MGLIREPRDVDFEVDPRPLTDKEREQISNYIKAFKAKRHQEKGAAVRSPKTLPKKKAKASPVK
jgi:hypothetical protein